MNLNRACIPTLILLGLAIRPWCAAGAMEIYHNTNASSSTGGEGTVDDSRNGTTPASHLIHVATSRSTVEARGRWDPGALESAVTLDLHSDANAGCSGQGADYVYVRAFDLVFSSSDPQATQAMVQMRAHVTWATQLPLINCGDLNDCNVGFVAALGGAGASASVDGQMGSAACVDALCGQPASGSSDFVTPTFPVLLNSPYYPTLQLNTMGRVGLCDADFTSHAVAQISISFSDPVFNLPPGVTANSADLGIVNNHWVGTTGCASILGGPANTSAPLGSPVSLSVTASGADTLRFQWYRNGVALTDGGTRSGSTTSTLSISSAAGSDSGLYTVTLENGCAPQTSTPARLSVYDPAGIGGSGDSPGAQRARLSGLGTQPAVGRMNFTLQMPRPGRAALEIVRPDGHLVAVIGDRAFSEGSSQIAWDGRSLTGERAPSGVYFVRLMVNGVRADSHKVVLLR